MKQFALILVFLMCYGCGPACEQIYDRGEKVIHIPSGEEVRIVMQYSSCKLYMIRFGDGTQFVEDLEKLRKIK